MAGAVALALFKEKTVVFLSRENIQLCYPADDKRISRLPDVIFAQPKLNGERCRVEWFDNEPILLSSYGNEFKYLDHIKDALKRLPVQRPWDGELYVHGWSRERIHSAVSRKKNSNNDSASIQFHIFDVQDTVRLQIKRNEILADLFKINESDALEVVPTAVIDKKDWLSVCTFYIQEGYEGIILRHPGALYQNKRLSTILKFKPTEHDTYQIVGVAQEVSQHGELKESLGSFLVTSDEGTVFRVGTGPSLTKELREHYWKVRESLPGKMLKVKHELLRTTNDIPIACVAVEVI
jgi:ATP-dependent DNA ligase